MGILGLRFDYVLAVAIVIPVLLAGLHLRSRIGTGARVVWAGVVGAAGLIWIIRIGRIIQSRLQEPTPWDFLTFWLGARVAAHGGNFYDPAMYAAQPLPLKPDTEFIQEIIEVGYAYPPMSMVFMLPLGWFDYTTAYAIWYGVTLLSLGLSVWLLARTFSEQSGWADVAPFGVLVLLLASSILTVSLGQSNFVLLLLLLLFWRNRDRFGGGVWLALAALVKPVALLILPWLVLRRSWRAVAGWAAGLGATALAAVALFGTETFFAYFTERVVGRFPFYVYTQNINQSALAVTLRWFTDAPIAKPYVLFPPFVIIAVIVLGLTAVATWRDRSPGAQWSLGAVMLAALLLYPSSLSHYGVITIIPLLAIWHAREAAPWGPWGVVVLATGLYVLDAASGGSYAFLANLLLWLALVTLSLRTGRTAQATGVPASSV